MLAGRWSKLLWMAALVPLFGASVLPTQLRSLVCRFTGALMDEAACCPPAEDKQVAPVAELQDQGCCAVRTVDLPKLLSDHRAESPAGCSSQPLPPARTADLAPLAGVAFACHVLRPPPLGPPLRLLKRSFLI
jgi:hypothetical protein